MSGQEWLLVLIVAPVAVALLIPFTKWSLGVLAKAIVKEINGQLGLTDLRREVKELKQDVQAAALDRKNLAQQLEAILVDRREYPA